MFFLFLYHLNRLHLFLFLCHLNRLHFIWAIASGFLLLLTQSFDKITIALKSQHCSCSPYCLYYFSKKIEALSPGIPQFFFNSFKLCCVLVLPCLRETPTWFIFKKTIRSLSTFVKLFLVLTLCFLFTIFYLFLFSFFFVWADWVFFYVPFSSIGLELMLTVSILFMDFSRLLTYMFKLTYSHQSLISVSITLLEALTFILSSE